MPGYQHLTRDELLNLAQERDQLTGEAQFALDSEIGARQIEASEVSNYARETLAREKATQRRSERSRFSHETRNRRFFEKKNRKLDLRLRVEEFDTTLWFVLWIPVFPVGSYRIRRRFQRWWNRCRSLRLHVLETRSRDWEQIFRTWLKTAGIVIALGLTLFAMLKFRL